MITQSEQTLENNLIAQLETLGFEKVRIDDEKALLANLKSQLEKHNTTSLSDREFKQALNKLAKGTIFEKAYSNRFLSENVLTKNAIIVNWS